MLKTLHTIEKNKLIAIIRENNVQNAYKTALACIDGGIKIIEITLNTDGALGIINDLSVNYPHITVGAGTVLDINMAESAINCGSKFIVSPHTDMDIIKHCNNNKIIAIPGATTPTEIVNAHKYGADIIKIFPISNLGGVSYIKNLMAPLPNFRLMPTGGVDITNIKDFLKAGVFAIGLSSALTARNAVDSNDFFTTTRLTQEIIKKVSQYL